MHQGGDAVSRMGDESFAFDPGKISAVVLSHAHLDHSGLLPRLYEAGFRGPVYCTHATADLLRIMLNDAVGLYLRDLERENRRRARAGAPPRKPAYDQEHVDGFLAACQGRDYGLPISIGPQATLCFYDAGHILGAAISELRINEQGVEKRLVYSGDLGKQDSVLMRPPQPLAEADLLVMESTYGDREHKDEKNTLTELRDILSATWHRGGSVMIPSFAVERTQEILFYLGLLYQNGDLAPWQVFLDSPMAIEVTRVYDRWLELLDDEDLDKLGPTARTSLESVLPNLHLTADTEASMAINRIKGGAIIIAGSGMCTGGRIRHHFKQRIWDANNTVIFVGFQARGTLGRVLVDGARRVRMFGDDFAVKARIETLGGLSAHAGQSDLVAWAGGFQDRPRTVLVHGEPHAQDALAERLQRELGLTVDIPQRRERLEF